MWATYQRESVQKMCINKNTYLLSDRMSDLVSEACLQELRSKLDRLVNTREKAEWKWGGRYFCPCWLGRVLGVSSPLLGGKIRYCIKVYVPTPGRRQVDISAPVGWG